MSEKHKHKKTEGAKEEKKHHHHKDDKKKDDKKHDDKKHDDKKHDDKKKEKKSSSGAGGGGAAGETRVTVSVLSKEDDLSDAEKKKYSSMFKKHDADGSDTIDTSELAKCLTECGFEFGEGNAITLIIQLVSGAGGGSKALQKNAFMTLVKRLNYQTKLFRKVAGGGDDWRQTPIHEDKLLVLLNEKTKPQPYHFTKEQVKKSLYPWASCANGCFIEHYLLLTQFLRYARVNFIMADTNGDGAISLSELKTHLPRVGLNEKKAKSLMAKHGDKKKDLKFEQFACIVLQEM